MRARHIEETRGANRHEATQETGEGREGEGEGAGEGAGEEEAVEGTVVEASSPARIVYQHVNYYVNNNVGLPTLPPPF